MKIAILSDSHDNVGNVKQAIEQLNKLGAEALLFCGDLCAPFVIKEFAQSKYPVHVVFGNNDGDQFCIAKLAEEMPHMTLHGEYAAIELGGKRIGVTHYPFYAQSMAKSGDYDLVAFGHDHTPRIEPYGPCLAVNPGSLYGQPIQASFALYDTDAHAAQLYALDGSFLSL